MRYRGVKMDCNIHPFDFSIDAGTGKGKTPVQGGLSSHSPKKGHNAEKLEENFLGYYNSDTNPLDLQCSPPDQ